MAKRENRKQKKERKSYAKLIRNIYLNTIGIIICAVCVVFLLRSAGKGKIGNLITNIYCQYYHVDWNTAVGMYWNHVRQYYEVILIGVVILFFLIFFLMLLKSFTRYFDEVIHGIYQLTEDENKKIVLSPELKSVESELNLVREELNCRQQEKEQAEHRKDELVVYLAHDIKTPLTSVIGYLDLLDEKKELDSNQREHYIHIAKDKAYRLETLINEFFEITKLHTEKSLVKSNVNLATLMVQVVDETYPMLQEKKKKVIYEIPEHLSIEVDAGQMARVFTNLLKNAIYYGTPQSDIHISAEESVHTIEILFENRGSIPNNKLEKVFDQFYRMDEARQTGTGGAGLGLAIAKDIVTAHGGRIWVTSEDEKIRMHVVLNKISIN